MGITVLVMIEADVSIVTLLPLTVRESLPVPLSMPIVVAPEMSSGTLRPVNAASPPSATIAIESSLFDPTMFTVRAVMSARSIPAASTLPIWARMSERSTATVAAASVYTSESLPDSPSTTSLPSPVDQMIVSEPSPPNTESPPVPPDRESFPRPPVMMSSPAPPEIVSSPPSPLIRSACGLPINRSSPLPPLIVASTAPDASTVSLPLPLLTTFSRVASCRFSSMLSAPPYVLSSNRDTSTANVIVPPLIVTESDVDVTVSASSLPSRTTVS